MRLLLTPDRAGGSASEAVGFVVLTGKGIREDLDRNGELGRFLLKPGSMRSRGKDSDPSRQGAWKGSEGPVRMSAGWGLHVCCQSL